jgi:hypothetical protein
MGDKLMYKGKWNEAEREYKSAIKLQPNSKNARFGLTKVQIFTQLEGKKFADSEAVDNKLSHFRNQFPFDWEYLICRQLTRRVV